MRKFLLASAAFFVLLIILYIPQYKENKISKQFSMAESFYSALEPNFLEITTDDEICSYLKARLNLYTELNNTPWLVIRLEIHSRDITEDFLSWLFVYRNNDSRTVNGDGFQNKIIKLLEDLKTKERSMDERKDSSVQRNVNVIEAQKTIMDALRKLQVQNGYDDKTIYKISRLILHHQYDSEVSPVSMSGFYMPEDVQKLKKFNVALIDFYSCLLLEGHKQAANAMRYLALRSHINESADDRGQKLN